MMKSRSCPLTAEAEASFLTTEPLSLDEAVRRVSSLSLGGVAVFSGCVRETEGGRRISAITYEAYRPMAENKISEVLKQAGETWKVNAAAFHRVGRIPAGEASLVVASAGIHREEAFIACRFIVDQIKLRAPIWKAAYQWI